MTERRLNFAVFYEGLFLRALAQELTPRLKERARAVGLDLDRTLEPAYDAEKFGALVELAREEVYPGLPREKGLRELGRRFLRGYVDTGLGKAMALMMRAIGPMKTLARMERNFRTGTNYVETRFTELGKTHAQLWINEVHGVAGFFAGVLLAGAEVVGAENTEVKVVTTEGPSATFDVSWD